MGSKTTPETPESGIMSLLGKRTYGYLLWRKINQSPSSLLRLPSELLLYESGVLSHVPSVFDFMEVDEADEAFIRRWMETISAEASLLEKMVRFEEGQVRDVVRRLRNLRNRRLARLAVDLAGKVK